MAPEEIDPKKLLADYDRLRPAGDRRTTEGMIVPVNGPRPTAPEGFEWVLSGYLLLSKGRKNHVVIKAWPESESIPSP